MFAQAASATTRHASISLSDAWQLRSLHCTLVSEREGSLHMRRDADCAAPAVLLILHVGAHEGHHPCGILWLTTTNLMPAQSVK